MLFVTRWFGVTATDAERNHATEQAEIDEIVKIILGMQANAAAKAKQPLGRGTHVKGVCVRAEFEVLDVTAGRDPGLAARLARGIYAKPGTYPATVRFANSVPDVFPDFKPDVRALSFAVDLLPGSPIPRQDYSMQSATTLPMNDPPSFLATLKVLAALSPAKAALSLPFRDKLRFSRTIALAQLQAHQRVKPYQQLRYWSTVPFRHGPTDVVKYCATPRADNPGHALDKTNPNALQDELIRHVTDDSAMSSFDFGLQFLDTEKMTYWGKRGDANFWIENASIEWNEAQAPFHIVARLTLLPKSHLSPEASGATYFDVTENAMPDSKPVGSMNRARWPGEVASRKARLSTGAARREAGSEVRSPVGT